MTKAQRIINVYVRDRRYQVNLDAETVYAHVFRNYAWRWVRTTSREIQTSAILRASDSWHRNETTCPQIDVPRESIELMQTEFVPVWLP